jgi:hypothetical protein
MDDDDLFGGEAEIVGGGGVNESFESAQDEFDGGNTDAAVVCGDLPPRPRPVVNLSPLEVQDTGDIEVEGIAQVDVRRAALQRAASLVKAQKTKNASNKNKERTSLAGAIVKLLEKDQHPSDGMAAHMSMMLMQQMEAIN